MNSPDADQRIHFSKYFPVIFRRVILIMIVTATIEALAVLFIIFEKPVFQSTITLVIDPDESRSPLTGERLTYDSIFEQSLTFKTHFQQIKSEPVMEKVTDELELDRLDRTRGLETLGIAQKILRRSQSEIRRLTGFGKEDTYRGKLARLIEKLRDKIMIANTTNTRLLTISVRDHDPSVAADIANSVGRTYIAFDMSTRLKNPLKRLELMNGELGEIRGKLEKAEAEFLDYKDVNSIFSIEGKQKIISQKIDEFNNAYIETRNKRLELDAKLRQLKALVKEGVSGLKSRHFRSLLENPLIDQLYSKLIDSEIALTRNNEVFRFRHPKVIQIEAEIDDTRKKLEGEIAKELENMKAERSVLLSRETVMLQTISEFEADARQLNKKELGYVILQRNVAMHNDLYDTLLAKIKKVQTTGAIEVSNIRISQDASIPPEPAWPDKKLILVVSLVFGLMTGIGLVYILEYFGRSVHAEDEITRHIGLPVLSVIPRFKHVWLKSVKDAVPFDIRDLDKFVSDPIVAEPYRQLTVNIRLAAFGKEIRVLMVSSAGKSEGKTFTALNLANSMSLGGKSVLLVDANLFDPTLTNIFDLGESPGLAEFLLRHTKIPTTRESEENIDSAIVGITPLLHVLPAGKTEIDSYHLLDSEGISLLISDLKQKFDFLIIDTPAILPVGDTLVLATLADGMILIVRAGSTSRETIRTATDKIRLIRANLLGAVLNEGRRTA